MSVTEVADAIGMNRKTVYQLIREGTSPLPFLRLGQTIKFKRSDVELLIGKTTRSIDRPKIPLGVLEAFCDFLDEASSAIRSHIEAARTDVTERHPPSSPRNP